MAKPTQTILATIGAITPEAMLMLMELEMLPIL
jgi:hypothetical protein